MRRRILSLHDFVGMGAYEAAKCLGQNSPGDGGIVPTLKPFKWEHSCFTALRFQAAENLNDRFSLAADRGTSLPCSDLRCEPCLIRKGWLLTRPSRNGQLVHFGITVAFVGW